MDPILLARIQFGANISFHILFPTITIALGWVLLFFKVRYNQTRNDAWMNAYRFWVKVFALSFALGVVSGITMSFQFGTNWPGFMERVGNIAGPLLASFLRRHSSASCCSVSGRCRTGSTLWPLSSWLSGPPCRRSGSSC
jgi:cytochrome bd-type quinol oxidase subunit 1